MAEVFFFFFFPLFRFVGLSLPSREKYGRRTFLLSSPSRRTNTALDAEPHGCGHKCYALLCFAPCSRRCGKRGDRTPHAIGTGPTTATLESAGLHREFDVLSMPRHGLCRAKVHMQLFLLIPVLVASIALFSSDQPSIRSSHHRPEACHTPFPWRLD
jgi:hypothetical protein